jgi:hypothetical protein
MACTVVITKVSTNAVAGQPCNFTLTITNNGASAVTIASLSVNETTKTGASIGQPNFLTTNASVGVAVPTINAAASLSLPFQVAPPAPAYPGPSPQNVGGGAQAAGAGPAWNSQLGLQATGMDSDDLVFTGQLMVPVLSAFEVSPRPEGGALDLRQGSNLINLLTL